MKPDVCIYHSPCADGFGAAYAVWERWHDVQLIPGVYGEAPPDATGKHVLLVDFSYKRPVLEAMSEKAASITILDHHKTAEADLETFAVVNPVDADSIDDVVAATQPGLGNIRAIFNMGKSGAVLAWEFCHPGQEVPLLLKYVEDRDLWRFELEDSRAIAAWVFSYPYDLGTWAVMRNRISHPVTRAGAVAEGEAIERKHHKDVAELLEKTVRPMVIGGRKVLCANLPYTMASDAAGKLAEGAPFGACYFDRADGMRVFSLRSTRDGEDVSAIAAAYGGGGHKHAAGFQMPAGWAGE
ncbi:MAG: hypothetical protein KDJ44_09225 [Rhodoblastus sp.]|nr:hypothetical protein [Rhodoblastus sp.]